jgi:hypothetical protein
VSGRQTTGDDLLAPDNQLAAYPNPVTDKLSVNLGGFRNADVTLTVYDMLGRICVPGQRIIRQNMAEINMAPLKAGVYMLQVESAGSKKQLRIVKE